MRLINIILLASASVLTLKQAPEKLTIGIKKRVPVAECTLKAKKGDNVKVHYVGTLFEDGKQFDSSRDRDSPFDFQLGGGQVIKGWDQGIIGMCVGELRKLIIPYNLAYGEQGSPPRIPAKACLVFEVELLSIEGKDKPSLNDIFTGEKEDL